MAHAAANQALAVNAEVLSLVIDLPKMPLKSGGQTWYYRKVLMYLRGPIAQLGSELPAHNRLVPGSNPGGPIPPGLPRHNPGRMRSNSAYGEKVRVRRDLPPLRRARPDALLSGGCIA